VTVVVRVLTVVTAQPLAPTLLTGGELAQLASLAGEPQRLQWLRSRRALRLVLAVAGLRPNAAAYRFPHRRLSLTHTADVGVAAGFVGPVGVIPAVLAGVGVDVEAAHAADPRAARFFLREHEQAWLAGLPVEERAEQQVGLWTVKEAVFKADAGNRHTLLRDYSLLRPSAGSGTAVAHGRSRRIAFGYHRIRLRGAHLCVAAAFQRHPSSPRRPMSAPTITFEEIADRIASTLSIPAGDLSPGTTLQELAADSFLLVEMVVDLQEEFDSMFTQSELRQITTLGELADLVRANAVRRPS
jgi:acyl carrier protein/phosphopantetheinyl transferase